MRMCVVKLGVCTVGSSLYTVLTGYGVSGGTVGIKTVGIGVGGAVGIGVGGSVTGGGVGRLKY